MYSHSHNFLCVEFCRPGAEAESILHSAQVTLFEGDELLSSLFALNLTLAGKAIRSSHMRWCALLLGSRWTLLILALYAITGWWTGRIWGLWDLHLTSKVERALYHEPLAAGCVAGILLRASDEWGADGEAVAGGIGIAEVVAWSCASCLVSRLICCCCSAMKQPCAYSAWCHLSLSTASMERWSILSGIRWECKCRYSRVLFNITNNRGM